MKLTFTAAEEQFREEVADWLNDNLRDEFADIRYRGGPGDELLVAELGGHARELLVHALQLRGEARALLLHVDGVT